MYIDQQTGANYIKWHVFAHFASMFMYITYTLHHDMIAFAGKMAK